MVSATPSEHVKIKLTDHTKFTSAFQTISVSDINNKRLDISLGRTVRAPDNGNAYHLPPDCGLFPIYSVKDYNSQLPEHMAVKCGMFVRSTVRAHLFYSSRPLEDVVLSSRSLSQSSNPLANLFL